MLNQCLRGALLVLILSSCSSGFQTKFDDKKQDEILSRYQRLQLSSEIIPELVERLEKENKSTVIPHWIFDFVWMDETDFDGPSLAKDHHVPYFSRPLLCSGDNFFVCLDEISTKWNSLSKDTPVTIHCTHGNRSFFWFLYHLIYWEKVPKEIAFEMTQKKFPEITPSEDFMNFMNKTLLGNCKK